MQTLSLLDMARRLADRLDLQEQEDGRWTWMYDLLDDVNTELMEPFNRHMESAPGEITQFSAYSDSIVSDGPAGLIGYLGAQEKQRFHPVRGREALYVHRHGDEMLVLFKEPEPDLRIILPSQVGLTRAETATKAPGIFNPHSRTIGIDTEHPLATHALQRTIENLLEPAYANN